MQPDHRNSFDSLRLAAALMVFHSHMLALKGLPEERIPWLDTSWSSVGVAIFFVISGYLVTKSVQRSPDLLQFYWRRAVRIMPGLMVNVLFCVLLGAVLTTLALGEYFSSPQTFIFLRSNVFLAFQEVQFELPGVFVGNPAERGVNGSLWTLPYEIALYVVIGFAMCAARDRAVRLVLATLGLAACFAVFMTHHAYPGTNYVFTVWNTLTTKPFGIYGSLFFVGALIALANNLRHALAMVLAGTALLAWGDTTVAAGYLLLGGLAIAIGESKALRLPARMGDLSYGVYLYAFPVQQAVIERVHGRLRLEYPVALAITFALAFLSWRLVEAPGLKLKSGLLARLGARAAQGEPRT